MEKIKNIIILFVMVLLVSIPSSVFATTNNNDNDKTRLEQHLSEQEDNIKGDMGNIVPKDDTIIEDTADTIKNAEYNGFDLDKKINTMTDFVNNLVVKSRTVIIVVYALIVSCLCIYISTLGSRNVNKRRNGYYLLIGNTGLFLVFINIPLIIIYFSIAQQNYHSISIINGILSITTFLRQNSMVICAIMAYLGISKYIVSKEDLPVRKQSIYLLKASVIVLIILNVIPFAINFII